MRLWEVESLGWEKGPEAACCELDTESYAAIKDV